MSRDTGHPCSKPMSDNINDDSKASNDIAILAASLFGSEAATAVAFCGIDAYLEGDELDLRKFALAFRRLKN